MARTDCDFVVSIEAEVADKGNPVRWHRGKIVRARRDGLIAVSYYDKRLGCMVAAFRSWQEVRPVGAGQKYVRESSET